MRGFQMPLRSCISLQQESKTAKGDDQLLGMPLQMLLDVELRLTFGQTLIFAR
jgi:hypothetical protein